MDGGIKIDSMLAFAMATDVDAVYGPCVAHLGSPVGANTLPGGACLLPCFTVVHASTEGNWTQHTSAPC